MSASDAAIPVVARQDSEDESVRRATLSAAQQASIDFSDEFMAQVRMFEAAYQGHWAYVKAYLDHDSTWVGIENPLGSQTGYKLVHQAAYYGSGLPVLLMLASMRANFLERTKHGETPSQIATARGKPRCASNIESLIDGSLASDGTPSHYLCPVTTDFMTEPVAIVTGHIFERAAIEAWISQRRPNVTDPLTGLALENLTLIPQPELQAEIRAYLSANPTFTDH